MKMQIDTNDDSTKIELPEYYTQIQPTKSKAEEYPLQLVNLPDAQIFDAVKEAEMWLKM